jgi:hypothetical protein
MPVPGGPDGLTPEATRVELPATKQREGFAAPRTRINEPTFDLELAITGLNGSERSYVDISGGTT